VSQEERKKPEELETNGQISRREFLRDAGLVVGSATISSMAILSSCKGATTETVTQTTTKTVTGAGGGTQTVTVTGSAPAAATKTVTVTTTAPGATITATVPAAAASCTIKLTINKGKYEVPIEPHWSLHHLLHDRLGWTGVKDMCNGYGACGGRIR